MNDLPLFADTPRIETTGMAPDMASVARVLNLCVGRQKAMKVPDLASAVGIPARRVQQIVHDLIVDHRAPIATAMSAPFGNYLAATHEEVEQAAQLHRSRAMSELTRESRLRGISKDALIRELQHSLEVA